MQTANRFLMVRPARFGYNPETALSNAFMQHGAVGDESIQQRALAEFDAFVTLLQQHDIDVTVVEDTPTPPKPDAVFPNNWVSFCGGKTVLYPMEAESRRLERRPEVLQQAFPNFKPEQTVDITAAEAENRFLEGTGSLVLDHDNKVAYACRSPRTDESLVREWGNQFGYDTIVFDAVDHAGNSIYHTNVVMSIGEEFVVVCLEAIPDRKQRSVLLNRFEGTPHMVIPITIQQMNSFAGNVLQVRNRNDELFVVLSKTALDSLGEVQYNRLLEHGRLITPDLSTIEHYGGGSARCMLAEVFH